MDKKLWTFCGLNILAVIGVTIVFMLIYNPRVFNDLGMTKQQSTNLSARDNTANPLKNFILPGIVGCGAILLAGCGCWYYLNRKARPTEIPNTVGQKLSKKNTPSLREWIIALLVFPGCLILPILIAVLFGYSIFW